MKIEPSLTVNKLTNQPSTSTEDQLALAFTQSFSQPDPINYMANALSEKIPDGQKKLPELEAFSEKMLLASNVVFDKSDHTISIYPGDEETAGPPQVFPAGNNTTSTSNGEWPNGTYNYSHYNAHPESGPNDAYGSNGNFVFDVPNRSGMGIHSGRENKGGPNAKTLGCVRTNDAGTQALEEINSVDSLQTITVQD